MNEITPDVKQQSQHRISDSLSKRYPFPVPAAFDPSIATTAYGSQSIEKILRVLNAFHIHGTGSRDETEKIRDNVRLFLEQLSLQSKKMLAISSGGNKAMLVLLDHKDAEVRTLSASVIASLAMERSGRMEACVDPIITKLCECLNDSDTKVQIAASNAIMHVAGAEEAQRKLVDDDRVVRNVVKSLKEKLPPPALPSTFAALANLCRFQKGCVAALESGIISCISRTMVESRDVSATDAATRCLVSVTGHPEGKVAALEANIIGSLTPLLASARQETRRLAGSALLLIAVNKAAKERTEECLMSLVQMLKSDAIELRMNGLLALRSISEYPDFRKKILTYLLPDPELFEKVSRDQQIHLAANRY